MDVTTLYEAARNAGLLTPVTVAGGTVHCAFRAPDETVLDGFALSRDYQIDYPASWLTLAVGVTVEVAGNTFRYAMYVPSATAPSVAPRSPNSEERPMNSIRERVLRRLSRAWHPRLP